MSIEQKKLRPASALINPKTPIQRSYLKPTVCTTQASLKAFNW